MLWALFKATASLSRVDTCAIAFLSVLLPTCYRTSDIWLSVTNAAPILPICMCGFIINDLGDIEKDKENHPNRPLPMQTISVLTASILYFTLLAASLILIKVYVDVSRVYLYLVLLLGLINYNYIVSYVPVLKNIYVAAVVLVPIAITASLVQNTATAYWIAPSLFMVVLGREMLMDVQDAKGDAQTLVKKIGLQTGERTAFIIKFVGSAWLSVVIRNTTDLIVFVLVILVDVIGVAFWHQHDYRKRIIHAMKLQPLLGINYLL